jgi:hypothetical protein
MKEPNGKSWDAREEVRARLSAAAEGRLTLSVAEAGALLSLKRSAAYRAVGRGDLPVITLNGRIRCPIVGLQKLLGGDQD